MSRASTAEMTASSGNAAVERDLLADVVREGAVGAQHEHVRLDTDAPQLVDRVLGGLGLELADRVEIRHQRDVDEADVLTAHVVAKLPDGLEERQRLDVADGPPHLDDDDLGVRAGGRLADARLDLVGDVRDDLDGGAQEVAPALLLDDRVVDRAGGDVGDPGEALVGEPLVVPEVQIGLGAVLGDEDLAVLEGAHGPGVHVEIGVALLQRHPHSARLQQGPERRGRDPLAETRHHAPGHEDVLHRRLSHMPSHRPTASARIAPASADTPGEFRSVRLRRSRLRYRRRASSSSAWRRAVASWGAEPSMRQSSSSRSSPATGSIRVVARPPGPSAFTSR